MKRKIIYSICLLASFSFTGCKDNKEVVLPARENLVNQGINGTLLASVTTANDFTLSVWELEPGDIAISTEHSMDIVNYPRIDWKKFVDEDKSFVELYKEIAGSKINSSQLNALKAADIRFQKRQIEIISQIKSGEYKIESSSTEAMRAQAVIPIVPVVGCSADRFGDNWGEQWWIDNFCIDNTFQAGVNVGDCQWNLARRSTPVSANAFVSCRKLITAACAADFNIGARFVVQTKVPATTGSFDIIRSDVNKTLTPRTTFSWTVVGLGTRRSEATGLPACPRVHYIGYYKKP